MGVKVRRFQRRMIDLIAGRKIFQKPFEFLLYTSIRCLNYNNGAPMDKNGELNLLKKIFEKHKDKESITLFDVGANVGDYSIAINEVFGKQAVIHAFEPSKGTFDIFQETTKGINNIFANNMGLSDKEEIQTLYSLEGSSYLSSLYSRKVDYFEISLDDEEQIRLSTIDHYCEQNKIERIHYLKLDVEGHELSILHGAKRMLEEGKIDALQFEFGGCNIDSKTYFYDFFYLLKDNYRIFRIVRDGICEIKTYTECSEIFCLINFVAIKR